MAKPYNHRRAENEYKKWKEKDERFMKKNGMPMDKILLMRDFDRMQFNSDRRFFEFHNKYCFCRIIRRIWL